MDDPTDKPLSPTWNLGSSYGIGAANKNTFCGKEIWDHTWQYSRLTHRPVFKDYSWKYLRDHTWFGEFEPWSATCKVTPKVVLRAYSHTAHISAVDQTLASCMKSTWPSL